MSTLHPPVQISPRLHPGVFVGGAWVSICYADRPGDDGRVRYRWHVDIDGQVYTGDDLQSGCKGGSLQEGLESLLAFLAAFAEAIDCQQRTGHKSYNAGLFPEGMAEWASENSDEIAMLELELSENPGVIEERS